MEVGYSDESGFPLTLPPTYAWGRRGEAKGVPRAWGSRGRVNVVGHVVGGREGVRGYLDRVAEGLAKPLKMCMDNASFHRSREVEGRKGVWRERGLAVAHLPR